VNGASGSGETVSVGTIMEAGIPHARRARAGRPPAEPGADGGKLATSPVDDAVPMAMH